MNTIKKSKTFTADIYVAGNLFEIEQVCRRFVEKGQCVTITPTTFVFTGGSETGARIGLIQYPRFERSEELIKADALLLAANLVNACHQLSCSVVFPDETIYISKEEKEKQ